MSFGYASGLDHAQVIPLNILVETIQVLVVYPLFALSWRQLIKLSTLQPFVTRMHRAAECRGGAVRRFSIVGRFVFLFVPFWMAGPVVGRSLVFDRLARLGKRRCRADIDLSHHWRVGLAAERAQRLGGNRQPLCTLCVVPCDCAHCCCDSFAEPAA